MKAKVYNNITEINSIYNTNNKYEMSLMSIMIANLNAVIYLVTGLFRTEENETFMLIVAARISAIVSCILIFYYFTRVVQFKRLYDIINETILYEHEAYYWSVFFFINPYD